MGSRNSSRSEPDKRVKPIKDQLASDEVHRIVPLGFTLREARAWYLHEVLMPRLQRASIAVLAASVLLGMMLAQPGELLDGSLAMQMVVKHSIILASGFLIAYGAVSLIGSASRLSPRVMSFTRVLSWVKFYSAEATVILFASAAALIAFWFLPTQFDAAVSYASLGLAMEATFLFAGSLLFLGSSFLGERLKFIAAIVAGKLMGLYGMFLLLTQYSVYRVYPVNEQALAGVVLLVMMVAIDFTAVPLLLYRYFGNGPAPNRGTTLV